MGAEVRISNDHNHEHKHKHITVTETGCTRLCVYVVSCSVLFFSFFQPCTVLLGPVILTVNSLTEDLYMYCMSTPANPTQAGIYSLSSSTGQNILTQLVNQNICSTAWQMDVNPI